MPGALRADESPWLPPPHRLGALPPRIVRFVCLIDFKHDGIPQKMGEPFAADLVDGGLLRRLHIARWVLCEVLYASETPLPDPVAANV